MRGLVHADLLRAELAGSATDRIASLVARCQALPRTGDNRNSPAHTKEVRLRIGQAGFACFGQAHLSSSVPSPCPSPPTAAPSRRPAPCRARAGRGPWREMRGRRRCASPPRPPSPRPQSPACARAHAPRVRDQVRAGNSKTARLQLASGMRRSSKTAPDKGWVGLWLTASARRAARRLRA